MYDINKPISSAGQATESIHTLYFDLNLNANPDDDFLDMTDIKTIPRFPMTKPWH